MSILKGLISEYENIRDKSSDAIVWFFDGNTDKAKTALIVTTVVGLAANLYTIKKMKEKNRHNWATTYKVITALGLFDVAQSYMAINRIAKRQQEEKA